MGQRSSSLSLASNLPSSLLSLILDDLVPVMPLAQLLGPSSRAITDGPVSGAGFENWVFRCAQTMSRCSRVCLLWHHHIVTNQLLWLRMCLNQYRLNSLWHFPFQRQWQQAVDSLAKSSSITTTATVVPLSPQSLSSCLTVPLPSPIGVICGRLPSRCDAYLVYVQWCIRGNARKPLRFLLRGEGGVGKSCFAIRSSYGWFEDEYDPTIGICPARSGDWCIK
jgi:hypothetical protein